MVLHTQRQWAKARCLFSFFQFKAPGPSKHRHDAADIVTGLQPGIALGASGGAVLGILWMQIFHTNSIGMYALLGACALLAASQQAPLMAICLVMELADAPINLFVPIGFAVAVSAFTASRLSGPLAKLRVAAPKASDVH